MASIPGLAAGAPKSRRLAPMVVSPRQKSTTWAGRLVDDLVDGDAGLLGQLPLPAGRVSRSALLPPDLLLALQQPLATVAHARKLFPGDDSAEDDESLLEQFLWIGIHPAAFTRGGCVGGKGGRVPGFQ